MHPVVQPSVVSLFAGIGGFDLGFARAGCRTVATVEIDANCRKLLAARWPDAVHLDDVRTAGKHNLPDCDVVVGGSPCQSFSVAGLRNGLNDPRGNLLLEYLRVVSELRPAWMVWENVPGVLSDKTKALYSLFDALEEISYAVVGFDILDAQFHGVAQRRRRILVCAQSIESLRSQKTATSASIFLQCLTEILQGTLVVLKGQLTQGAGNSDLPNGKPVHSVQRRMKLFGLLTEEQASPWLNNLAVLLPSSDLGQDASESTHGSTSRQDATAGKDINCGMESETITGIASGARQNIGASWRSTLEEGLSAARSCITSTAPSETIELRIFTCAQACLIIAKFTQGYLASSLNYWKTATSSLTALKEFIEYARKTSSDLFGDVGRLRGWNTFIQEAEELCSAFERTRIECFGALFPLEKGVFWHPAPSREKGEGVARRSSDGSGVSGTLDCKSCGANRGGQANESEFIVIQDVRGVDKAQNGRGYNSDGTAYTVDAIATQGVCMPEVAGCLQERDAKGVDSDTKPDHLIPVAFERRFVRTSGGQPNDTGVHPCLRADTNTGDGAPCVATAMSVRRLTPRECSRLQGFPDDWLDGLGFSDSTRYRMLGNAVCVNVAEWIANRLVKEVRRDQA